MTFTTRLFLIFLVFTSVCFSFTCHSLAQNQSLEEAEALNKQVKKLYQQGRYSDAVPVAERALAIFEKELGPEHPDVAQSLNNLEELYVSIGDYARAALLYKRALAIFEKALGPKHSEVAKCLNNLAGLYYYLGDYARAEPLYKKALAIKEKALGPEHPDVATTLNNLALLYDNFGDYARAVPLYKRALTIREKALGPEHPRVATTLNNLALLYSNIGDYDRASPLYKRALTIREKVLGPEHPNVATTLNNLALLYSTIGDYDQASSLYKRALAIREKVLGPEHPDVANSLNNMAATYESLVNYDRAEPLYKKALAIVEKVLYPEHPHVATCLNNLAGLYHRLGDYARAEPLDKRALAIVEKALGPEHAHVATTLYNLASLYYQLGDWAQAVPLYKRALAIMEKVLGPEHEHVAATLNCLAWLNAAFKNFKKSHHFFMKAQQIDEKLIDQVMGFTSEEQKIKFLAMQEGDLHGFLNLINQHLAQNPYARKDALNVWLKRKGVILEAQKRFQEALIYSDNPEAVKIFQELARLRSRLSKSVFAGPGKEGPQKYRLNIANLEKQIDALEADLSRISNAFALKKKIAKADCAKIAQALPDDTLLIEFAKVDIVNFKAVGKEKKWHPPHYLSFLLYAGQPARVSMIDLGDAALIDQAVAEYKSKIKASEDTRKAGRKVYDLVFAPLKKELGDVKEVFLSPDGNLNLIPFEVLPGPDGRFLIEDYTFNYLAAGRDLLGFGEIKEKSGKALLIGDPDFDMPAADAENANQKKQKQSRDGKRSLALRAPEMRGLHFKRLPGTLKEVKAVHTLLGSENATLYTGREALEDVLMKTALPPSILHIATHGFFLSDIETDAFTDKTRGLVPTAGKKIKIENPLLRSGIVLAGANIALKSAQTEKSEGIVYAEEILGLKLRGTDMTVLSACETGLGDVKAGEGVYGLRRAFTQAGSKSLVMSMWSVPDMETKELMVNFYKNIAGGKMKRSQALRQAALKEMDIVKQRYGQAHPMLWGAFVFMGEP